MKTREHIAVLSDFDGTITIGGVMDLIYTKFAEPSCWELVERWIRGEITTPQEIQGCFSSMKATREEMESILDSVQIDPSFPEFVQFCQKQKYPLAVLSDGLKWYISYILNRFRIDGLQIYANEINFLPDGYQITTPYFDPITPKRGVSKPRIIEKFKSDGYKVIFIGDGLSDIEAVHVADVIYARDELLNYCVRKNVPATGFSDMRELISKWKTE
jgi:2-hydroxy-3-keto-5-methylthiopentenyl-1-phosphate phosphatase